MCHTAQKSSDYTEILPYPYSVLVWIVCQATYASFVFPKKIWNEFSPKKTRGWRYQWHSRIELRFIHVELSDTIADQQIKLQSLVL